ncbi:MAG: hypothetical protein AAFZ38_07845 [Myxococcota bacterium]
MRARAEIRASAEADRALDQAAEAIYRNRPEQAETRLAAVKNSTQTLTVKQAIRLHLLEASVALLRDDEARAREAVRLALRWNPELRVDLNLYLPSIARIAADEAPLIAALPRLEIETQPVHASVQIDSVWSRTGHFVPKSYRVVAESEGWKSFDRNVSLDGNSELLTINLEPKETHSPDRCLVTLNVEEKFLSLHCPDRASSERPVSLQADAVRQELDRLFSAGQRRPLQASVGLMQVYRDRSGEGDDGRFDDEVLGLGVRASLSWNGRRTFATSEIDARFFGFTVSDVEFANRGVESIRAGRRIAGRLSAGGTVGIADLQLRFGPEVVVSRFFAGNGSVDEVAAAFPDLSQVAGGARLSMNVPVIDALMGEPLNIAGFVSWYPWVRAEQDPEGSGQGPSAGLSGSLGISVVWGKPIGVQLAYDASLRRLQFSGEAANPLVGPSALTEEIVDHALTLGAVFEF